jgi:predicted  nucleic acid-binding Zn-ribbon protein
MRYDFAERLDKSKLDFRWEMLQRIEATIKGVEEAIQKGMDRRNKGEKEVEKRKEELLETEKKLYEIKNRLEIINKDV